jgi:hypothetical protein
MAGTVTTAEADAMVLVTEVAVRVTCKSLSGGVVGAVYLLGAPLAVAVGESMPQGAAEHDTAQVTPWFAGSLLTVAVNCAVVPAVTVAGVGATETVIPRTVTLVEFIAAELVTDAAVIVTPKSPAGGAAGAV